MVGVFDFVSVRKVVCSSLGGFKFKAVKQHPTPNAKHQGFGLIFYIEATKNLKPC